jgi:hypothetical protein
MMFAVIEAGMNWPEAFTAVGMAAAFAFMLWSLAKYGI